VISTTVDESGTRRAVTKLVEGERLVSCTCCATAECCMYPASQLEEGYSENELPAFAGGLARSNPPAGVEGYGVVYFGNPEEVTFGQQIIYEDGAWKELVDFAKGPPFDCLFPTLGDPFADEYFVETPTSDGIVTRQSLCVWTGTDNYGCALSVVYDDTIWKWKIIYRPYGPPCGEPVTIIKDLDQSTPVGDYDGIALVNDT
jgi:hypothetical protein